MIGELFYSLWHHDRCFPVKENSAGKEIESGTMIKLFFNTPEELWGPDAKRFIPDRWLRELTSPAKDIHGYRHLYTFIDGPRMCLGKDFSVTEFKLHCLCSSETSRSNWRMDPIQCSIIMARFCRGPSPLEKFLMFLAW
ncbi:hypothetical protein M378DRAFT_536013 [Amanita muscaria Koide BX008]|uniref:Cytochrome P450 n=1 Tax=Amanita muscaria (strain Koide BX008) TaxID=946122 RepID=A0A0C2X912_AMAMK|nr:hypothetical protein M378DRAFT_536013 [Amanita muscaria Koide BX008]